MEIRPEFWLLAPEELTTLERFELMKRVEAVLDVEEPSWLSVEEVRALLVLHNTVLRFAWLPVFEGEMPAPWRSAETKAADRWVAELIAGARPTREPDPGGRGPATS
jgi:hypothetical protein